MEEMINAFAFIIVRVVLSVLRRKTGQTTRFCGSIAGFTGIMTFYILKNHNIAF